MISANSWKQEGFWNHGREKHEKATGIEVQQFTCNHSAQLYTELLQFIPRFPQIWLLAKQFVLAS